MLPGSGEETVRGRGTISLQGHRRSAARPCSLDRSRTLVLFQSATIQATGNSNYSLVGLTDEQAAELKVTPAGGLPPSVDADIAACQDKSGEQRTDCWVALDKKLMEQVVPWVPYLFANNVEVKGPTVSKYQFDQFSGSMAFVNVAVDPTRQK